MSTRLSFSVVFVLPTRMRSRKKAENPLTLLKQALQCYLDIETQYQNKPTRGVIPRLLRYRRAGFAAPLPFATHLAILRPKRSALSCVREPSEPPSR